MEKTIQYTDVDNFWNNKVIIKEIKTYADNRGMVSEIFRVDSDLTFDSKMCYISDTNPFIMRGPHEHKKQKDVFISWGDNSRMVYYFYNKEADQGKFFVTEPKKVYAVIVHPTIVHSYRNISLDPIKTLNFPDALYKGENKKEEIDEIRYEEHISPTPNIWILGAGGRLGKAITKELFDNMKMHIYNVFPIYDKFENNEDGNKKLNDLLNHIATFKNSIVINCIAKTNVQDETANFEYENFLLPRYISRRCIKEKIYFIHFSTDYVYQSGVLSPYTRSKIMYESWMNNVLEDEQMWGFSLIDIKKYVKIIRVANLFSLEESDKHNLINKIYGKIKTGSIVVPKKLIIMPTSVEVLSKQLFNSYIFKINEMRHVEEFSGKAYKFEEFKTIFLNDVTFDVKEIENPKTNNNTEVFLNNDCYTEIDCYNEILQKIKQLKG